MPLVGGYEAPLRHLPPLHRPPIDKPLPFGPPNTVLLQEGVSQTGRIIVGGGRFGYMLSSRPRSKSQQLGWAVTASLFTLNERGRSRGRVKKIRTRFKSTGEEPSLSLVVPPKAGFFRFDISFKRRGKVLGMFSEYLRVLDPVLEVRISTMRSTYRPGETLLARVENVGTEAVGYGAGFAIERLTGAGWIRVGPNRTVWPKYATGLGAGEAGECMKYAIPNDFPIGRYRFSKAITSGALDSDAETLNYSAEFELVP
jgi:Big-like domain-containing protein